MASAELLKKLMRGHVSGDDDAFMAAAREVIEHERKKEHNILADDLGQILSNGGPRPAQISARQFRALPRDNDRDAPLLEVRDPRVTLDDLVLTTDQTDLLADVVEQFAEWDVLSAHGLRPSHKLLFCGPPGCGKTVTAEAMASMLGLPMIVARFDAIVSSLLGETASNLARVFHYMSGDTWVVLFDEFDAIGRSRDDPQEHGELKRVVNAFLQMLDDFRGRSLVIAATNFAQALDPALWRRFDEIVRFECPDGRQARRLIRKRLRLDVADSDVDEIAERLVGMSHGEIERVCLDALKRSILDRGARSTMEYVENALQRQVMRLSALTESTRTGMPHVDGGTMNGIDATSTLDTD